VWLLSKGNPVVRVILTPTMRRPRMPSSKLESTPATAESEGDHQNGYPDGKEQEQGGTVSQTELPTLGIDAQFLAGQCLWCKRIADVSS
jgi:hypothetical protein